MSTNVNPHCSECGEKEQIIKNGFQGEDQKYKCKMCGNNFFAEKKEVIQDDYIGVDPAKEGAEGSSVTEIAPDTVKSDEEIAEEMKNPKHEAFKANYRNKFPEPKESKKYGFTFDSWDEYYHKRAKAIKELPKEETE